MILNQYPGVDLPIRHEIDGNTLVSTTYYDHPYCTDMGYFCIASGEGASHLLVPPMVHGTSADEIVAELSGTKYVIASVEKQSPHRVYLLFEDESKSPYTILVSRPQCVPAFSDEDDGTTDLRFMVHTGHPLRTRYDFPLRIRFVSDFPCNRPWDPDRDEAAFRIREKHDISKRHDSPSKADPARKEEFKRCPSCGKTLELTAKRCSHCGFFTTVTQTGGEPSTVQNTTTSIRAEPIVPHKFPTFDIEGLGNNSILCFRDAARRPYFALCDVYDKINQRLWNESLPDAFFEFQGGAFANEFGLLYDNGMPHIFIHVEYYTKELYQWTADLIVLKLFLGSMTIHKATFPAEWKFNGKMLRERMFHNAGFDSERNVVLHSGLLATIASEVRNEFFKSDIEAIIALVSQKSEHDSDSTIDEKALYVEWLESRKKLVSFSELIRNENLPKTTVERMENYRRMRMAATEQSRQSLPLKPTAQTSNIHRSEKSVQEKPSQQADSKAETQTENEEKSNSLSWLLSFPAFLGTHFIGNVIASSLFKWKVQNSYRLYDGAIDLGTLLSFLFYKGVASVASIMAGVLVSKNFKTAPKVYGAAIVTMALVYWFCIDEKTQLFGIVGQFLFTAIPVIVGIVAIIIGFSSDPKNR